MKPSVGAVAGNDGAENDCGSGEEFHQPSLAGHAMSINKAMTARTSSETV